MSHLYFQDNCWWLCWQVHAYIHVHTCIFTLSQTPGLFSARFPSAYIIVITFIRMRQNYIYACKYCNVKYSQVCSSWEVKMFLTLHLILTDMVDWGEEINYFLWMERYVTCLITSAEPVWSWHVFICLSSHWKMQLMRKPLTSSKEPLVNITTLFFLHVCAFV